MRPSLLALPLAAALLAAAPVPAHAAAATVERRPGPDPDTVLVHVTGTAARDDLIVRIGAASVTVAARSGRPPRAGTGCRRVAGGGVRCVSELLDGVRVRARGGDDRIAVDGGRATPAARVEGGADNDTLALAGAGSADGQGGHDVLRGGAGGQRLVGGAGRDRLSGGRGDDVLEGDGSRDGAALPARPDVLDGGPGRDRASWAEVRRAITIRLDAGTGGGDRLRSIEDAVGGRGADRLVGSDAANRLFGAGGADLLVGNGGDDRLDAGSSRPGLAGGVDRAADRVKCGAGDDVVDDAVRGEVDPAGPLDVVPADCERVGSSAFATLYGERLAAHPRPAGARADARRVRVDVPCDQESGDCRATVTLSHAGRRLGRGSARVRRAVAPVLVRLTRPLPPPGAVLTVAIASTDRTQEGEPAGSTVRWRVRR